MGLAAKITQSFALDNGAYSKWKKAKESGKKTDWSAFYEWVERWKNHPRFDWAVIPDVIEGGEDDNDELAEQWPFALREGAVVWHTDESQDRLIRLARQYPRVAIGSSGKYDAARPQRLVDRMLEVLPDICDEHGYPICKLHGLRMLNPKIFSQLPLSSADSTNVARNIGIDSAWRGTYQPSSKPTRAAILVERIESVNSACYILDL